MDDNPYDVEKRRKETGWQTQNHWPFPAAFVLMDDEYLAREARARKNIDAELTAAGWQVQSANRINLTACTGVAVREFALEQGHGRVDYLLFLNGQPAGVIEAKPEGTTLIEVEHQSGKYVEGLPDWMRPPVYPLPFIYESTGAETRFTNGYDPDARSRRVFSFHRPETLVEWARQIKENAVAPTFRARLRTMPELDATGLWSVQADAVRNTERSLREDRPRALIQMLGRHRLGRRNTTGYAGSRRSGRANRSARARASAPTSSLNPREEKSATPAIRVSVSIRPLTMLGIVLMSWLTKTSSSSVATRIILSSATSRKLPSRQSAR
jgi:hypothetical protein